MTRYSIWTAPSDLDWRDSVDPPDERLVSCDCCGRSVPASQTRHIDAIDAAPAYCDTTMCDACADEAEAEMLAYLPKRRP